MEQTIRTLDERLRARSEDELTHEISQAAEHIKNFFTRIHRPEITVVATVDEGEGKTQAVKATVSAFTVMDTLEEMILAQLLPKRQNEDIQKFIAQVDTLQEQVNNLKNGLQAIEY